MGEINLALGLDGAGQQVEALGKTWTLSGVSKGQQAAYEAWLELGARMAVIRTKGQLSPADYRESLSVVNSDIGARLYSWGGPDCVRALETADGWAYFVYLLLRERHPDATPELALKVYRENPDGVESAIRSLRGPDPNGQAPAGKTPG